MTSLIRAVSPKRFALEQAHKARFSLLGLLLLVTGMAVALAIYVNAVLPVRRHQQAVRELQAAGHYLVEFENDDNLSHIPAHERPLPTKVALRLDGRVLASAGGIQLLRTRIAWIANVQKAFVTRGNSTGGDLAVLAGIGSLEELELHTRYITDADIAVIASMRGLKKLLFTDCESRCSSLEPLGSLTELEYLRCDIRSLSAKELEGIGAITNLQKLELAEKNHLNDEALNRLLVTSSLTDLRCFQSQLSVVGYEAIAASQWLEFVEISNPLSDEELACFFNSKGLQHLKLHGVLASAETLQRLQNERMDLAVSGAWNVNSPPLPATTKPRTPDSPAQDSGYQAFQALLKELGP